jgi:hypothetical protein
MKSKTKIKTILKTRTSRQRKLVTRSVVLAHSNQSIWRHFRLVEHKHTGKIIHHRHSSHVVLVGLLLMTGCLLYSSGNLVQAETGGTVSVGVIVPGPAPTIGAIITAPTDGTSVTDQNTIEVKGTCVAGSFVVVQDSKLLAGSTVCTDTGIFTLQIQLYSGKNVLSALNYDNLNQPGPVTPSVTVNVTQPSVASTKEGTISEPTAPTPVVSAPILPTNPSIIPGVDSSLSSCDDYKVSDLPVGGEPHMEVVCVPRLFMPKLQQVMGVLVWGGSPPYAISVDWGDGSGSTLLSLPTQGYKKTTFSYASAGNYNIAFKLKDSANKEAIVQTAVQVSGEPKTPIAAITDDIIHKSWLDTPVPIYIMAVAITLGFWGGDIFDRKFGAGKPQRRARKMA